MTKQSPIARHLVHDTELHTGVVTAVKRLSDGEIFRVGDYIILSQIHNGQNVNGHITHFSYDGDGGYYVYTTWSNVGFQLEGADKKIVPPSEHQVDDKVVCTLLDPKFGHCQVTGVHFFLSKVKYDLDILSLNTRIYNVESNYVEKIKRSLV